MTDVSTTCAEVQIETDQSLLTNSARVFQPITSWLNRPITFNRPDFITSSTDNYSSLDSEDHLTLKMTSAQVVEMSVTNNSSFQNYTHPDDHTIRTTDTPRFKPFTLIR